MNVNSLAEHAPIGNTRRFVPARAVVDARTQYMRDYDAGFELYATDKRLPHNASVAMGDGYKDAMDAGADAYHRCMMRDGAVKFVNWNSGAEVW